MCDSNCVTLAYFEPRIKSLGCRLRQYVGGP